MPGGLFLACAGTRDHGLRFLDDALRHGARAVAWEPAGGVARAGPAGRRGRRCRCPASTRTARRHRQPLLRRAVGGALGHRHHRHERQDHGGLARGAGPRDGSAAARPTWARSATAWARDVRPDALTTPGLRHGPPPAARARRCGRAPRGRRGVVPRPRPGPRGRRRVPHRGLHQPHARSPRLSRRSRAATARRRRACFSTPAPRTAVINVGDDFGRELAARLPAGTQPRLRVCLRQRRSAPGDAPGAGASPATARPAHRARDGEASRREFVSPLLGAFNVENLAVAAGILLAEGFGLERHRGGSRGLRRAAGAHGASSGRAGSHAAAGDRGFRAHARMRCAACSRRCGPTRRRASGACSAAAATATPASGRRWAPSPGSSPTASSSPTTTRALEDPDAIVAAVLEGAGRGPGVEVIRDRAAAIRHAIRSAAREDIVLIAGKGHESVQIVGAESPAVFRPGGRAARCSRRWHEHGTALHGGGGGRRQARTAATRSSTSVSTDTRSLQPGQLFFAFRGARRRRRVRRRCGPTRRGGRRGGSPPGRAAAPGRGCRHAARARRPRAALARALRDPAHRHHRLERQDHRQGDDRRHHARGASAVARSSAQTPTRS